MLAGIADEAGHGLRTQISAIRALGWGGIELRCVDRFPVAELDEHRFARVVEELAAAELHVVCLASRIGSWARPISGPFDLDLTELDVLARRCAALGTRYVRVMSYPNDGLDEAQWRARCVDRLRVLATRAEDSGVTLLHENCSGWAGTSAKRMLELLDAVDSPALRLLFDTGNGIPHGYDGLAVLKEIVEHVAHVHVKDAVGSPAEHSYTLPGAGQARVTDCVRLLRDNGYTGAWSLEPHLGLRPHEPGELAADAPQRFLAAGRAMTELLR
ncbi:hypothetical protein GCM10010174_55510 [Kutzneria viridogrisea]|uniref:Xylose isomerase n=1 Tax=Kutzneria albida DSM 43870 TaxID=1449976 RepID=W5WAH7_9PSEU|nr:xylose isomerase [Kutzneria albida DSM 43870]